MRVESFFADFEKLMALKLPAASRRSFFYRFHSKMTGNKIHSLPNDCATARCGSAPELYDRHYARQ